MTHDRKPPRQPLFWAALAFSLGLWMGVRAWRPPSWWVIAVVAFVFAASWFLSKRAWLAKALSLGAWILLGAFLIQVRGQRTDKLQENDARILALADGRPVTLTARVIREAGGDATLEMVKGMGHDLPTPLLPHLAELIAGHCRRQ